MGNNETNDFGARQAGKQVGRMTRMRVWESSLLYTLHNIF